MVYETMSRGQLLRQRTSKSFTSNETKTRREVIEENSKKHFYTYVKGHEINSNKPLDVMSAGEYVKYATGKSLVDSSSS